MINGFLELSRVGYLADHLEDVPFEEIVLAGLNNVEASRPGYGVTIQIEPDMPIVGVDLTRMIEVLQNLIKNAVKFTGERSDPQIMTGIRSEPEDQVFFLSDNGEGIDPEYRKRIFNIFGNIYPQSGGIGVGLALVKRIVERNGGRLWVESEGAGKGSVFCFTLPSKLSIFASS